MISLVKKLLLLFLIPSAIFKEPVVLADVTCHNPADTIIVLDASGSVGFSNWQKSVEFACNLGDKILALHRDNKVGLVEFSQVANEALSLTKDKDLFDLAIQVLNTTYQNGITRTELALKEAIDMFKKESILESDNRVLVIVTDGKTTPENGIPGNELLLQPTTELKSLGVHVIAVGVSDNINIEELNLIATDPDSSNVMTMSDYDDLLKKVDQITQVACPTQVPGPSPQVPEEKCDTSYHKIGCFHDDMKAPRPLPDLLFTDRDETSPVSSGIKLDWDNWSTYLDGLVCRCSKAAKKKGYLFFSIQYYGECWSGPEAGQTYKRNGVSAKCITKTGQPCTPDIPDICAGEAETNYVYGINVSTFAHKCPVQYERVGCYNDDQSIPRPLPLLISTDRDPSDKVYSNITIDWNNWDTYIEGLVCRCARIAQIKRFPYFGVQYYGECWSGPEAAETYGNDGESANCISDGYKPCLPSSNQCVGKEKTNFVYKVPLS